MQGILDVVKTKSHPSLMLPRVDGTCDKHQQNLIEYTITILIYGEDETKQTQQIIQ